MSVWEYIYLAIGTAAIGAASTAALVLVCSYLGIDVVEHVWLLALPLGFSLLVNIVSIEIYRRRKPK